MSNNGLYSTKSKDLTLSVFIIASKISNNDSSEIHPTSGTPVPGAKEGSSTSISKLMWICLK